MERRLTIVGLGEALFDVFPDHRALGGAPLNVAVHAHQLASINGGRGVVASRVGRDEPGREILADVAARGMATDTIQVDDAHPTGRVVVTSNGPDAAYEIVEDVAWDYLEFGDDWRRLAKICDAVCFGTLAQRGERSRETIGRFLDAATGAVRLFDVNLRQDDLSVDLIQRSCTLATVVKLNAAELPRVCAMLGLVDPATQDGQAEALRARFALDAVVLTRGAKGTALYTPEGKTEGEPVHVPPAPGADSVGAGDACSAGVLVGRLLGWPAGRIVALADALGAFVASQPGATPRLPARLLDLVTTENP